MYVFAIILLLSSVNAQFFGQQRQYLNNNYNQWLPNPIWNQGNQQNQRLAVRGYLLSTDPSPLPYGSQIIVTLADVSLQDVASRPLNTFVLSGSYRFPIPFQIPYTMAQLQGDNSIGRQYAIQARIEKDGQLLFINDQNIPVQLIPAPINSINILLRRVNTYPTPGPFGVYTAPPFNGIPFCLQIPEVGPCKANIEQYYFNTQTRSCQIFQWGGCGGNSNRFGSREECERACSGYRRRNMMNNVKQRWIH